MTLRLDSRSPSAPRAQIRDDLVGDRHVLFNRPGRLCDTRIALFH